MSEACRNTGAAPVQSFGPAGATCRLAVIQLRFEPWKGHKRAPGLCLDGRDLLTGAPEAALAARILLDGLLQTGLIEVWP